MPRFFYLPEPAGTRSLSRRLVCKEIPTSAVSSIG